jgi:hypothetical protein
LKKEKEENKLNKRRDISHIFFLAFLSTIVLKKEKEKEKEKEENKIEEVEIELDISHILFLLSFPFHICFRDFIVQACLCSRSVKLKAVLRRSRQPDDKKNKQ